MLSNTNTEKYIEKKENKYLSQIQRRLLSQCDEIEGLENLISNISENISKSQEIIGGISGRIRKHYGISTKEDEEAVNILTKYYDDTQSPLTKFFSNFRKKKNISLEEGLNLIEETIQKIPEHITLLTEKTKESKENFRYLKTELRNYIQQVLSDQPLAIKEKNKLKKEIEGFKTAYKKIDEERATYSEKGISFDEKKIIEINSLENEIGKKEDFITELEVYINRSKKNIEIANAQIRKSDEFLELLGKISESIYDGKTYVDVVAPYIINEVKSQKTAIKALTGTNTVLNWLEKQKNFSQELNKKIKLVLEYVSNKLEGQRKELINSSSIYPQLESENKTTIGGIEYKLK